MGVKLASNLLVSFCVVAACVAAPVEVRKPAAVSSLEVKELVGFEKYPEPVQKMIERALALTKRKLTYRFASADPGNGGMDCSGTIYYLLRSGDIDAVPRQSDQICQWLCIYIISHFIRSQLIGFPEALSDYIGHVTS